MVDDMGRGGVPTRAAEPLATCQAPDDATWVVDATIAAQLLARLRVLQMITG